MNTSASRLKRSRNLRANAHENGEVNLTFGARFGFNFALILIKFGVKIAKFWFELKFAEFNGENRLAWLNSSGADCVNL